jgi:soluble lytic murein transglycosylase-like protein
MLRNVPYLVVLIGLAHPTYSSQFERDDVSTAEGLSLSKYSMIRFQIERNFKLKSRISKHELYSVIDRSINEANPKHLDLPKKEAANLSHEVVRVSECYGIDPVIYTGLVWRESNFKPLSTSETGAVGLTQMTKAGIKEVLDRLSPTSHRRLGYLRSLVKKCSPSFMSRVPPELSADTLAAWKNSMRFSNRDSLVMGALLLKINLASSHANAHASSNTVATYQQALARYNGDPKIKEQFAKDVLLLAKRMIALPEVALNDSKFLSQIRGL